ncbi:hypothetical protein TW78_14095 [Vibrio coralliilyticus]|uniref:Uncharacterized protein n=1 Tax=Vibrio coralliilyticus TaxID=190893 RepID=A0A837GC33_9VIBR|nr:hypothetical protein [Vibrio coralliilyticus]KJY70607.1 hypothetical protein TW78_14095 [Vibrio coralliilyticus]QOU28566.1 hypothetical protein TW71_007875 [Vibrio coralliilyticus]
MADYYQQQFEQKTEELKKIFEEHSARLEDKIEAKNSQISERAIEKTLKIVSLIGGSLVAFIFLFGVFGYGDVKESVTQMFTRKVDNWLQIDENESPLKESILTFRDRTLLDSLYVRLKIAKLEQSRTFELSNSELEVIIGLANNKELSLSDYRLILDAYQTSHSPFGFGFYGDYKSNLFDKIMTESGFNQQAEKQKKFFETFKRDRNILKYCNGILGNADHHLRHRAFDVLAKFSPANAREYIEENFDHIDDNELKFSMVIFMVNEWINTQKIENYSKSLLDSVNTDILGARNYFELLISMIEDSESASLIYESFSREPNQEKISLSATMLEEAINYGATVKLADFRTDYEVVVIEFPEHGYLSLESNDFEKLYTSRPTIDKVFDNNLRSVDSLAKAISFYEIRDDENYILSVSAKLNSNAMITLEDGNFLKSNDLIGNLWLTVDKENKLIATYRDRTSKIISSHVKELINFNGADVSFVYNKEEVRSLLYKKKDYYY